MGTGEPRTNEASTRQQLSMAIKEQTKSFLLLATGALIMMLVQSTFFPARQPT